MRGKMWFLGGLAVGFVVGARAGREKYEELVQNARKVWDHPTVQEAAGVVQAQASRFYAEGKDTVSEKLSHTRLGEKLRHDETRGELENGLATTSSGASTSSGNSGKATPAKTTGGKATGSSTI
jgi:hypothetical protein